jgi:hypothetical protein
MSTRDLMLIDLYQTPRSAVHQEMAARHAPILNFDLHEPFLPLAAGYTIFESDGPSPSMERAVLLRPEGKPAAARAVEYAIWWDWDIHHLYELEHVWVYLNEQEQLVRVEASWHGEYHEIPLNLQDGRAVLFSEPGKHAFAPTPDWFRKRASEFRRSETQAVGLHAGVLINAMFRGKIRQRMFDTTLARSFLVQQAFTPAWDFSRQFRFLSEWLVPWPALADWIPERVNTWLEKLQTSIRPTHYRALRLMNGGVTLKQLQSAAAAQMEAAVLDVYNIEGQLKIGPANGALPIEEAFQFLFTEPMGAFLQPVNQAALEHLAAFIQTKGMEDYAVITSADAALLRHCRSLLPRSLTAVQTASPQQDPLQAAQESGALLINPRYENLPRSAARAK